MQRQFMVAAAAAVIVLAGCTASPNPPSKPAEATPTGEETPTPTPTPTSPIDLTLESKVTARDYLGYTVSIAMELGFGEAWETSLDGTLPGQAGASLPVLGSVVIQNTTEGRDTPAAFSVEVMVSYPADSPVCAYVLDQGYYVRPVTKDGRYCYWQVQHVSIATTLPPEQTAYAEWTAEDSDGGFYLLADEDELPGLIEAANKPAALFVVVDSASGADWNEGPPLCALNLGPINFGEDDYKLWVVAASPGFECVA